jgi:hypothetical protein
VVVVAVAVAVADVVVVVVGVGVAVADAVVVVVVGGVAGAVVGVVAAVAAVAVADVVGVGMRFAEHLRETCDRWDLDPRALIDDVSRSRRALLARREMCHRLRGEGWSLCEIRDALNLRSHVSVLRALEKDRP